MQVCSLSKRSFHIIVLLIYYFCGGSANNNGIHPVQALDGAFNQENREKCKAATGPLIEAVDNLTAFASNPEFASIPAQISPEVHPLPLIFKHAVQLSLVVAIFCLVSVITFTCTEIVRYWSDQDDYMHEEGVSRVEWI